MELREIMQGWADATLRRILAGTKWHHYGMSGPNGSLCLVAHAIGFHGDRTMNLEDLYEWRKASAIYDERASRTSPERAGEWAQEFARSVLLERAVNTDLQVPEPVPAEPVQGGLERAESRYALVTL